ncbi:MAG TPA: glycosyltransferase, partial [Cyclobacteriaceae bacterium]|nr:glycosyltransferase [Cyclobacteriaceae bacterium]
MTFSVAITSYNRPLHLIKLVHQVMSSALIPNRIVVVDSSERPNEVVRDNKEITYIRSSHKNQPYQRYIAYCCCRTDIIIFLDDDLEIIDNSVFDVMLARLQDPGVRGVSVGFEHHNAISNIMDSQIDGKSMLFRVINFISGIPILKPGKIYMAGLAGIRPTEEGTVDYFNGAIMGFYTAELAGLFDPVLFSLFERKLGMGEDKVISMKVGLTAKLWFV